MSLRPVVSASCRAALRDLDSASAAAHVEGCSFCAARKPAAAALGAFVAARPEAPAELSSPATLEQIYGRVVEMAEQGPVAEWLDAAPAPEQVDEPQWQDSMLDSDLARELVRRPASPGQEAWSEVRRNILDGVAAQAGARRRNPFRWPLLMTAAAAVAVIGAITVSDGTKQEAPIVFTELGKAPDVPFAVVRYGSRN